MPVTLTQLQTVINREFKEPLGDLVVTSNPTLAAIQKRSLSTAQLWLKGRLSSDHETGAVADGATVTVTDPKTNMINPTLNWATYVSKFSVGDRALKSLSADDPYNSANLLMGEIMFATKDLANKIAQDLFAGTVSNGLVGLQSMIANDNTYAGVDRTQSANANFRCAVVDAEDSVSGDPSDLSTIFLSQLDTAIFDSLGYGLSERSGSFTGLTGSLLHAKYERMLESIDLAALSSAHFVNQMNASGNLGFKGLAYKGNPIIRDRNVSNASGDLADSGRLYFADLSKVALFTLAPADPSVAALQEKMGVEAGESVDGLNVEVVLLGKTGEATSGYVRTYIQLAPVDGNPKVGGLLKNINVA